MKYVALRHSFGCCLFPPVIGNDVGQTFSLFLAVLHCGRIVIWLNYAVVHLAFGIMTIKKKVSAEEVAWAKDIQCEFF